VRLAIAGKGGAGKTTISATLARQAARAGRPVVAVDADSNPNLGVALGVHGVDPSTTPPLPTSLVSRRFDGPALTSPIQEVVEAYGLDAPDGVRLVHLGMPTHAEEGCLCSAHATVGALLGDLGTWQEAVTLVDLEASPEHLSRGTARHVDTLLLVAEPYFRALETVRRMAELAAEMPIPRVVVVANKIRSTADAEAVEAFCAQHGLEAVGAIPWSAAVLDADAARVPLSEQDGDVVRAIGELGDRLLGQQPAA
jgi:CO dehydrogenase maturation factor